MAASRSRVRSPDRAAMPLPPVAGQLRELAWVPEASRAVL